MFRGYRLLIRSAYELLVNINRNVELLVAGKVITDQDLASLAGVLKNSSALVKKAQGVSTKPPVPKS